MRPLASALRHHGKWRYARTAQWQFFMGARNVAKVRAKPQEKQKQSKKNENHGESKLTEAQIAVHWKEEEYFQPPAKFIGQANLNDPAMVEKFSEKHFPECFREYADLLDWDQYWHTT